MRFIVNEILTAVMFSWGVLPNTGLVLLPWRPTGRLKVKAFSNIVNDCSSTKIFLQRNSTQFLFKIFFPFLCLFFCVFLWLSAVNTHHLLTFFAYNRQLHNDKNRNEGHFFHYACDLTSLHWSLVLTSSLVSSMRASCLWSKC